MTQLADKLLKLVGEEHYPVVMAKVALADRPHRYLMKSVWAAEVDLWRRRQAAARRKAVAKRWRRKVDDFKRVMKELGLLVRTTPTQGKQQDTWVKWMLAVGNLLERDSQAADETLASLTGVKYNTVQQWRSRGLQALRSFMSTDLQGYVSLGPGKYGLLCPRGVSASIAAHHRIRRRDLLPPTPIQLGGTL